MELHALRAYSYIQLYTSHRAPDRSCRESQKGSLASRRSYQHKLACKAHTAYFNIEIPPIYALPSCTLNGLTDTLSWLLEGYNIHERGS